MLARKFRLELSASAIALFFALGSSPVHGQVAADAQNSDASGSELEEIVVTARKRDESLLQTPVAVSAISEAMLERAGTTDLQDIAKLAPQVIVGGSDSGTGGSFTIRGVGSSVSDGGLDPSVLVVVDGVNSSRGYLVNLGYFDLEQVEVLKGPQALFFGKNSPAGVISLQTKGPTQEFEGYIRAGYEFEYHKRFLEGAFGGPITDTLKGRIALRAAKERGNIKNNAIPIASNPFYGGRASPGATFKYFGGEEFMGRGTLAWEPSSDFDMTLKVSGGKFENNGTSTQTICDLSVPGAPTKPTVNGLTDAAGDCKFDKNTTASSLPPELAVDVWPGVRDGEPYLDVWSIFSSLDMNYRLGDLTLSGTTGYYKLKASSGTDFTYSSLGGLYVPIIDETEQFSQEVRLTSDYEGPLNFTLGGYFERVKRTSLTSSMLFFGGFDPLTGKVETYNNFADNKFNTESLFGQLRWRFVEQLELAGGVRYTHEKKKVSLENLFIHPAAGGIGLLPVGKQQRGTFKDSNWSPELTLSWTPNNRTLVYAAYKTGYKSGGFSNAQLIRANQGFDQGLQFDSEKAKGFEIGAKAELANRTVRVEFVAYNYKYSDLQVAYFLQSTFSYVVQNAAALRSKGAELALTWLPVRGLRLNAAAAYNRARFIDFPSFPCYRYQSTIDPTTCTGGFQDLTGAAPVRAPDWVINAGLGYDTPIGSSLMVGLNADVNYSDSYYVAEDHAPISLQKSYAVLNAGVRLYSEDERWELAFIGRNLTDKLYTTNANGKSYSRPTEYVFRPPQGREMQVQATFRF